MTDVQYLFNSSGEWIAFRKGRYVFNTNTEWIGWLPWQDLDVVSVQGAYIGTIFPKDRFYKKIFQPYRG